MGLISYKIDYRIQCFGLQNHQTKSDISLFIPLSYNQQLMRIDLNTYLHYLLMQLTYVIYFTYLVLYLPM